MPVEEDAVSPETGDAIAGRLEAPPESASRRSWAGLSCDSAALAPESAAASPTAPVPQPDGIAGVRGPVAGRMGGGVWMAMSDPLLMTSGPEP